MSDVPAPLEGRGSAAPRRGRLLAELEGAALLVFAAALSLSIAATEIAFFAAAGLRLVRAARGEPLALGPRAVAWAWAALAAAWIVAGVFAIPLRFNLAGPYETVVAWVVFINLILCLFNLIPVHPLDGSHILVGLLPLPQARRLELFYHQYGIMLLILLVVTGATGYVVGLPALIAFRLLTGHVFLS